MDGMIVDGQSISGGSALYVLILVKKQNAPGWQFVYSEVQGQSNGQTLANLDTGTSLAEIPQSYAEKIYGSVPGSQLLASQGIYVVPCDTKLNISFVFG